MLYLVSLTSTSCVLGRAPFCTLAFSFLFAGISKIAPILIPFFASGFASKIAFTEVLYLTAIEVMVSLAIILCLDNAVDCATTTLKYTKNNAISVLQNILFGAIIFTFLFKIF